VLDSPQISSGASLQPGKAILARVERAVRDFRLIEPGARVAVAISGGKDSLLLASVIRALAQRADMRFEWTCVHLDQRQPGFNRQRFEANLARFELPCTVVAEDTWSVVESQLGPGQIPCSLCSRMRRGILHKWCADNGWDRLALGHHLDDAIETFFLNLLFQRRLAPLKPATPTRDGKVTTIRPLLFVSEAQVVAWMKDNAVEPVACPVCDNYPQSQRRDLKHTIEALRKHSPNLSESVRKALYEPDTSGGGGDEL
jgi:tRNA 2-thiocytidine biosynthesis protein TtcA